MQFPGAMSFSVWSNCKIVLVSQNAGTMLLHDHINAKMWVPGVQQLEKSLCSPNQRSSCDLGIEGRSSQYRDKRVPVG